MEPQLFMRRLDTLFHDDVTGRAYRIYVHAVPRADRTWKSFLEFRPQSGASSLRTDIETTQPNVEAVVDWATGLTDSDFEGAFARAAQQTDRGAVVLPVRLAGEMAPDATTRLAQLREIERFILETFRIRRVTTLRTDAFFDRSIYANADLVRAFEDLEKRWRYLLRETDSGVDRLRLTFVGAEAIGLQARPEGRGQRPETGEQRPERER